MNIDFAYAKIEDLDDYVKQALKEMKIKMSKFLLKTDQEKKAVKRLWDTTYNLHYELDDFSTNLNDDILMHHGIMPKHVTPAVVEAIIRKRIKRMIETGQKQTVEYVRAFQPIETLRLQSEQERFIADKVFTGGELTEEQKVVARKIFPNGIPITARKRESYIDEDGKVKYRVQKDEKEEKKEKEEAERKPEDKIHKRKTKLITKKEKDAFGCKVGSQANKINEAVIASKGKVFTKADIAAASGCDFSRASSHLGFLVKKGILSLSGKGYAMGTQEGASNAAGAKERRFNAGKKGAAKKAKGAAKTGTGKTGKIGKIAKKIKKTSKKGKK